MSSRQKNTRRRRPLSFEPLETRQLLAGLPAPTPVVDFRIEAINAAAEVLNEVKAGQEFHLQVSANDLRADGAGVFAAYADVRFSDNADIGAVEFGTDYPNGRSATSRPGLLDEIGAFGGTSPLRSGPHEVFKVPVTVPHPGKFTVTLIPAEGEGHEVLLYGEDDAVPAETIQYPTLTLTVLPTFTNLANPLDVNEDGRVTAQDALIVINEMNMNGVRPLTNPTGEPPFWDVTGDDFLSPRDALIVINYVNSVEVLLQDDFEAATLDAAAWVTPSGSGSYFGQTQIRPPYLQPVLKDGRVELALHTYNPTARTAGDSFWGSEIDSRTDFAPQVGEEIVFEAVGRFEGNPPAGLVAGIFAYNLNELSSPLTRDEIDFELLTKELAADRSRVLTNVFENDGFSSAGNWSFVDVPGFDPRQDHRFELIWRTDRIEWRIDGVLVRTVEGADVPDDPMSFRLNLWVPDRFFAQAYDSSLKPVASASLNTIYIFSVDRVEITRRMVP
ncbi:MAG: dockerin type I domain-containing protein [Planctomycetota bacterium]